jgi:hypothetical protein
MQLYAKKKEQSPAHLHPLPTGSSNKARKKTRTATGKNTSSF